MKNRIPRLLAGAFLLISFSAHAQLVADGATNTLANVTTNITGTVTVGTNGSFTLLTLADNVLVTNTTQGIIGANSTAKSNEVRLVSATARWQMGSLLLVGSNGAFNRLVVTNGGRVTDTEGYVGFNASASNNEAVVTGAGSTWSNGPTLVVGVSGPNNRLEISDGGWVTGDYGIIGSTASSVNNRVLVTGGNSTWSNRFNLEIGTLGNFNELVVSNGGQVINNEGRIGNVGAANRVTVTGAGSLWNASVLTVGLSGANNRLAVEGGGRVNSFITYIGSNPGSRANEAVVSGAGSLWNNPSDLTVGLQTAFNSLLVSNGGWVVNADGIVGWAATATNNTALVTGAGSVWSNANLHIGRISRNNQLIVSNGATVMANVDTFLGHDPGASNNLAVVTGAGSLWTTGDGVIVGYQDGRNQLVVSNGGMVVNNHGYVGYFSTANNNAAVVTGAGSVWNNRVNLNVGVDAPGNSLVVSNGGLVTASNNIIVGVSSGSLNNRLVVNGGTMRAANAAGTSAVDVRRGTNQLVSGLIDADRLVLTNAAGRFEFLGGTLITRGAFLTNGSGMVVGPAGGGPAFWDVRPGPSNHYVSLGVVVGNGSSSNQLLISGGALLTNNVGAFIGLSANGNTATVTEPGSRWRVAGQVNLGAGGAFNTLTVSDGGRVDGTNGVVGGSSNLVAVTGAGSVWSNSASLFVGDTGPGNQLQVSGGGLVVAAGGSLGQNAAASANTAQIAGAGSEWRFSGGFTVGAGGALNQLQVSGGARVSDISGIIGGTATGTSNAAVVSGPGSLWNNVSDFSVGSFGDRSELTVSDGGMVATSSGSVGDSSSHNLAVVTGAGTVWSNDFILNVGYFGHSNRVRIENGALLVSGRASIGDTGRSNEVSLTGAGSVWNNRSDLTVGRSGRLNQLVVSDGTMALTGGEARIGDNSIGSTNAVVTSGPGSRWLVTSNLIVGNHGSFNGLVVSNGAFVSNLRGYVGRDFASNNLALITGAGSVWSNASQVSVGEFSADNQLMVSNGASLLSQGGSIGLGGDGNLGMVTGPSSKWNVGIAGDLTIGDGGASNQLVVSNGGQVTAGRGFVGLAGSLNTATVTGAGTLWSNRGELTVGGSGSANRLNVQFGGTVFGDKVFVGKGDSSINNRVLVQNGTLRVTNATSTGVLDVRRGTNVLNSGLVDVDKLVVTNVGTSVPVTHVKSGSITIPDFGAATPYPSTLTAAGLAGNITEVTVTLSNLSHEFCVDLDILLVSPGGQKVMLMSDAGGNAPIVNGVLTFDDHAGALVSPTNTPVSGTYRPTAYGPAETMVTPAPAGPYSTTLSSFNGINPNGIWSLYIMDDQLGGVGTMNGWSLRITTDGGPFSDPATFELNGGTLITRGAFISNALPFVVGGPGGVPAVWETRAGLSDNFVVREILVGNDSSFNQLVCSSGVVTADTNVIVGASPVSSNNLLHVTGGTLRVLTPNTVLDVRGGTNRIDAGLVELLHLVVTNTRGQFDMFGGTLRTPDTTISNGRVCIIGGGASLATLQLLGGTHTFANNLTVATNGSLIGTGNIDGTVTVSPGGRLTPGAPIGSIDVIGSVILQGTVNLQIDKSGGVRTSDEVIANGAIFYNGTLNVTDIGTDVLTAGDRFLLFDATPYLGAFATLNLPPLGAGLAWENNLSVDGSIEVVVATQSQPKFSSAVRSGANLILSGTNGTPNAPYAVLTATNVTTPAANWQSLVTNQFGASGQFSFTNGINANEPQRYFRLRSP